MLLGACWISMFWVKWTSTFKRSLWNSRTLQQFVGEVDGGVFCVLVTVDRLG